MFKGFRAGRAARHAAKAGDIQGFVERLGDPEPKVRMSAANACMLFPAGSAPPQLVDALLRTGTDADAEVRGQAIVALGSLRVADGRDLFLRALNDGDAMVRMFAATAIGWMPDPRAVERLKELLHDDERLVRQFAVAALGETGDRGVIPAIRAALEDDRDSEVRSWAEEALGKLGASA